ncbi:MAG: retention module-containing protein [Rhodoferax sp.]
MQQSTVAVSTIEGIFMATSQTTAQARGIVVILQGNAWVRDAKGTNRLLHIGDEVQEGQVIVTEDGTRLELALPNGQPLRLESGRELLIDANLLGSVVDKSEAALKDLNGGSAEVERILATGGDLSDKLESTALGLAGGDGSDAHSFVRLLRIQESVTPLAIDRAATPIDIPPFVYSSGTQTQALIATTPPAENTTPTTTAPTTTPPSPPADPTTPSTPTTPAVNHAPLAVNDSVIGSKNSPINLTPSQLMGNDSDPDGDALTILSVQNPVLGTVSLVNGNVVFTPTPNVAGPASFTYTISDGHGGTSTATVNITFEGPGISITDKNGATAGQLTVNEAGLASGSLHDGSNFATGTMTVTAPNGLASIDFGNTNVSATQLNNASSTSPVTVTTSNGTLQITGFDASTGQISYSYSISKAVTGPNAASSNVLDSMDITVNDSIGNKASTTFGATILDDAPKAVADTGSITEDATPNTLTGNVLTNDSVGADTNTKPVTASAGTINLTYGTLNLQADGNYTYTLNNANATVNALKTGQSLKEVFNYKITDGDGDTSTATLTITINGHTDGPPSVTPVDGNGLATGQVTVNEAGLSGGSLHDGSNTSTGVITVKAPDGLDNVVIGGTSLSADQLSKLGVTPVTIDTGTGSLTLTGFTASTGALAYTYTIKDALVQSGLTESVDKIALVVNDLGGDSSTGVLTVQILDDVPSAVADTINATQNTAVTGSLATNDTVGADAPGTWAVAAGPAHGTVTVGSNGAYTYTPTAGYQGSDSFTYTLTDKDGDVSTATANVTVYGPPTITITDMNGATPGQVTVTEAALSTGSNATSLAESATGTMVITAPNGVASIDIGSTNITAAQLAVATPTAPINISTPDGVLSITNYTSGTLSYTYTISAPQTGPNAASTNVVDSVNITVHDNGNATASASFKATILDDVPTANADTITTTVGQTATGSLAGNDVVGADNPGTWAVATGPVHGTVTVTSSGGYTYTPTAGYQGADSFTYTLTDKDGDASTATVTVNIGSKGVPTISIADMNGATAGQVTVNEAGLANGTLHDGSNSSAGTITVSAPNGLGSIDFGSTNVTLAQLQSATSGAPITVTTPNGSTLAITGFNAGTGVISYNYTLNAAQTGPNAASTNVQETFNITVHDATGLTGSSNTASATFTANILDDAPVATNVSSSIQLPNTNINVLLTLDVSGSMTTTDGGGGQTRLQLLQQSVSQMLDDYDRLGAVRVAIVSFSTSAVEKTTTWVDVATAKTIVNGLTAAGSTNYDAAISAATSSYSNLGKIAGAQTVAYFLTDGQPNLPTASVGMNAIEQQYWQNFLTTNSIKSYSFGLGTGATQAALDPIAYNGVTGTDTTGTIVPDISKLPPVLRDTVSSATSGNIVATGGSLTGAGTFGADGGYLTSLTVDGTTYSYNPASGGSMTVTGTNRGSFDATTQSITIETLNGGKLVTNMSTGAYSYVPSVSITNAVTDSVAFSVIDKDGDTASANLTINVAPPALHVESITSPTVNEGSNLVYTVTLSSATTTATALANFVLGGGTATAGSDYTVTPTFSNGVTLNAATKVLTVPAGVSSFTVTVPTIVDAVSEKGETVPLTIGATTGVGTISGDQNPVISINNVTVSEGAFVAATANSTATSSLATFTVTLSEASTKTVTVTYATANAGTGTGFAVSGTDFTAATGTITFNPGETTKTVDVTIRNDTTVEPNETFLVKLSSPTNATVSATAGTGTGTIVDDDGGATMPAVVTPTTSGSGSSGGSGSTATVFTDTNETVSVAEDKSLTGSVLTGTTSTNGPVTVVSYQVAGNPYTFTAGQTATIAGVGTVLINTDGTYTFTPSANYNGSVPVVTYKLTDGTNSVSSTLTITVTPVTDGFTDKSESVIIDTGATSATGSVLTGTTSVDGTVHVTNYTVAGDATVHAAGTTTNITGVGSLLINADGSYVFTPASGYTGAVPLTTYSVTDGVSTLSNSTLAFNFNHAPVAAADAVTTTADTALTITAQTLLINDTDSDGNALKLLSVTGGTHGSVILNGTDVVYTPTAGYSGSDTFQYTISDGHGGTSTANVAVQIDPVNHAPVAVGDSVTGTVVIGAANQAVTIASSTLLANDTDADKDTLSITSVLDATHGTVALAGGNVVFTPTKDYVGNASFTYVISDGHGGTASATVDLLLKAGTP